jgi:hypothetical protein
VAALFFHPRIPSVAPAEVEGPPIVELEADAVPAPEQPPALASETVSAMRAPVATRRTHQSAHRSAPVTLAAELPRPITEEPPEEKVSEPAEEKVGDADEEAPARAPPVSAASVHLLAASPAEPGPTHLASDLAKALRIYDEFPLLPGPQRWSGARQSLNVDVCVSNQGLVSGVTIAEKPTSPLGDALRAAMRSWRYRPLIKNGGPAPFCHTMIISYALN